MKLNEWHKLQITHALEHGYAFKIKTWGTNVYKELWALGIISEDETEYGTQKGYALLDKKKAQKILRLYRRVGRNNIEVD